MRWAIFVALVLLACGCEKRQETAQSFIPSDDSECVVTLLLDMSGSFQHLMIEGGQAYRFALQVIDKYFRERLGSDDRLIIAQISANGRALLWEGTPLELRQRFPSAAAFATYLREKSSPYGSPVHDAITNSLEYVLSKPANGKRRSALFVLSDMMDTGSTAAKEKTTQALRRFGQSGGVMALYYVDQSLVPQWRSELSSAGIREFYVESEIVSQPRLPTFD